MTDRLSLSELVTSQKHSLLLGLRWPGHEAQLTQVIASISANDSRFASAFVSLVLRVAAEESQHAAAVKTLGSVPSELQCQPEHSLYDSRDLRLGRVDLRFDGGADFTLFVENKLFSGFGEQQLERYKAALDLLPEDRLRTGLVAITRDVPTYGELNPSTSGWLGSVRWARLRDIGLRDLPIKNANVRRQWALLIDILDAEGDLGVTTVDGDLVRAWAQYVDGRELLADVMESIRAALLAIVREELARQYGNGLAPAVLSKQYTEGKGKIAVKRPLGEVWSAYQVPGSSGDYALRAAFYAVDGEPFFTIEGCPKNGRTRWERGEEQMVDASRKLQRKKFRYSNGTWWRDHAGVDFLGSDDVAVRLLEFARQDVRDLVKSGLLDKNMESLTKPRARAR